jgi:AcrR family transcriptional regulator
VSSNDLPQAPRLPSRTSAVRRPAPRERTLSRDAIAGAALRIVDAEGLDAMTMRRVAEELRTGAASLYAHVANKEELLELVVERAIGEVEFHGEPDPEHWQEQVKRTMRGMRATIGAHGDLARAMFARIPLGENALRGSEWLIRTLRAGGLPDQVIAYACDLLPMYVMAITYEDSLYMRESVTPEQFAQFIADMRRYLESLPVDRFPSVVALAGPMTSGEGDERFEFGLDVLIRGLAAMADWAAAGEHTD